MGQREQVIQVMEQLGGVATLGMLNQKVNVQNWNTDTPYASIRRIIQDTQYFFKIKSGLWALNSHRDQLGHLTHKNKTPAQKAELDHYYYQGLLLEIGNVKNYQTFIPNQDKNKEFLKTTLGEIRKLKTIYPFSYKDTVNRARTVDVLWFNRRNMPHAFFEVENSTDFTNALSKYIALQDFKAEFYVVANKIKNRQFAQKIVRDEYVPIRDRVKFLDYEELIDWHSDSMQINRFGELP